MTARPIALHSNSLNNKMDNSLLAVRGINHKYIVVGDDTEIFIIWEGYFDQIMRLMTCGEQGWTGLAYCYDICIGWYEESPWIIEDLQMALKQFEKIDSTELCDESVDILMLICNRFREAINNSYEVFIVKD